MTLSQSNTAFRPLQIYEQVADTIRTGIREGLFPLHSRLPSERELAGQFRVSRPAVREAIGSLQNEGLVVTRHGSGTYILRMPDMPAADPSLGFSTDQMTFKGLMTDMSPMAILDARDIIEPAIVRMASQHACRDEMAEYYLKQMSNVHDLSDPEQQNLWKESDRLFHRQLAVMTQNPLMVSIADVIAHVMGEPLWNRLRDDGIFTPERISLYVAEHRLIYEAITAGEGDAGAVYIQGHLRRVRKDMTSDK